MLKYFLLLLISLTCLASEPKFHFMDCVKIKSGFYKDYKGTVSSFYGSETYEVEILDCKNLYFSVTLQGKQLEPAKGCSK